MSKKRVTCKDYYGSRIRQGDTVALFSDKAAEMLEVKSITQIADKNVLVLEKWDKTLKENVDAKDCYLYDSSRNASKRRVKKWVGRDMQIRPHIYTKYKDVGGIPLAERMVLQPTFEDCRVKYYVAKDKETEQYYLQCFADFRQLECQKDVITSMKESIEKAKESFDVQAYLNGVPLFLEDYGLTTDEF